MDQKKKRKKKRRERGKNGHKGAHIYILPCLNLRQRSDRRYFQLNARNDPEGWIGGIDTTVHSRNECSVHFESSILVSIILRTTLAACTLVLPVIIRTSVSEGGGGKVSGVREKNKRQVGTRATIPYLISGVARFAALLPPLLPSIYFTFRP